VKKDPISIVREFNDCINNQDIGGLSGLMADDHTFVDRDGSRHGPKQKMVDGWKQFFKMFPDYRNTFHRIIEKDNLVYVSGFAFWSDKEPYDPVIWSALLKENLITEWRVYEDTPENREKFDFFP
jgi:predicted SnoaL-like aldol condensation-catalyzing enzyme